MKPIKLRPLPVLAAAFVATSMCGTAAPHAQQKPATVSSPVGLKKDELETKYGPPKKVHDSAIYILIGGRKTLTDVRVCEYEIPVHTDSIEVEVTYHGNDMVELEPKRYYKKPDFRQAITDLGFDGASARINRTYFIEKIGGLAEPWRAHWFNEKEKPNTWHLFFSTQHSSVVIGPSGAHRERDEDFKRFMSIDDESVFPRLQLTAGQYKQTTAALDELRQKNKLLTTTSLSDTPDAIHAFSKSWEHLIDAYDARLKQILTNKQYARYMSLHYGKGK